MKHPFPQHRRPPARFALRAAQRGVGMLEALIALLIFAFGLLAAAGLQLSSLQASQFASQSVTGTNYLRDYSELMQMVPASVKEISTATDTSGNDMFVDTSSATYSAATASQCLGKEKACTPDKFAKASANDWALRVTSDLPAGRAKVCKDATPHSADGELEWGRCDGNGVMVLGKIGWAAKAPAKSGAGQAWMTADRPRIAITMLGNTRDFSIISSTP